MNNVPSIDNTDDEDDKKNGSNPKKRRKSVYFGYACKRSFELRELLLGGQLTVDGLLDMTRDDDLKCPRHSGSCQCQRLEGFWVSNDHGRLALKLFLKYLEGETLKAFSRLVAANVDRLEDLKRVAAGHPALLKKINMLSTFS